MEVTHKVRTTIIPALFKTVATDVEAKRMGWIIDPYVDLMLAQRYCQQNGLVLGGWIGARKWDSVWIEDYNGDVKG